MAAGHSVDPGRWLGADAQGRGSVPQGWSHGGGRGRFVLGLLAALPRANCRTIAGHAGDASSAGMQHLLSRACWDADGWCAAAGIPEATVFATKPELALAMITRALDAGTPAGWVTGDGLRR
jgi:hypothetical protein